MPLDDTQVMLSVRGTLRSPLDLVLAEARLAFARGFGLSNGTGANQADKMWSDSRQIAASGTDDIDLAGVLTDALGAALTFATVKGLFVAAAPANTNNVVIGAGAANQFIGPFGAATHTVAVRPGGFFAVGHPGVGWTVTPGTGDLLRIANSGAGSVVNYDIVIIGTSA